MGRFGVSLLMASLLGAGFAQVKSVAALRDTARPLLVFTPSARDGRFLEQVKALRADEEGMRERQVKVLVCAAQGGSRDGRRSLDATLWQEPPDGDAARRSFGVKPGEFTVVLVGKDGGEKLREHTVLSVGRLRETIDAMPMRQDEMKKR